MAEPTGELERIHATQGGALSFRHLLGNFALTFACLYMLKMDGPPLTDFLLAGLFAVASGFALFSRADLAGSEGPEGGNRPGSSRKVAKLLLLFLFCLNLACATSAVWLGINPEQPATEEEPGVNTKRAASLETAIKSF